MESNLTKMFKALGAKKLQGLIYCCGERDSALANQ